MSFVKALAMSYCVLDFGQFLAFETLHVMEIAAEGKRTFHYAGVNDEYE